MAATDTSELVQHPHLTTVGLFLEAHTGLVGRLDRALARDADLTPPWFGVLVRLFRTPGHRLRMSDLAAQTTLSPSGLTRVVDRLEAQELVRREECPSDRRGSYAVLTDTGEARIAGALPGHVAELEAILDDLYSPAELDTLSELLRRLRDRTNPCAAAGADPDAAVGG
jgi:DNA-binding MarR family transcriptional regulator